MGACEFITPTKKGQALDFTGLWGLKVAAKEKGLPQCSEHGRCPGNGTYEGNCPEENIYRTRCQTRC